MAQLSLYRQSQAVGNVPALVWAHIILYATCLKERSTVSTTAANVQLPPYTVANNVGYFKVEKLKFRFWIPDLLAG